MIRLFTALEIPGRIGAALQAFRGGLPGARWIEPADYHITLRFIGDVGNRCADEIADQLTNTRRPPLEIRLTGLEAFGGSKPRAIIAKVQPSPDLLEFQSRQERLIRRAGLPPEMRKFTPHVTLARLRDANAMDVADFLASRGRVPALNFTAENFVLFSSRASVGGGPYVVEADYPLWEPRPRMVAAK